MDTIRYLSLTDYVTYNATQEELEQYGMDDPQLTVTMDYTYKDEEGEEQSDTFILHISRDPEEQAQADAAESGGEETGEETDTDEDEEEEITAYARVGESQIVYQISGEDYTDLMAASQNDLRHQEVIWADTADITQLDITLEGEDYTITLREEDDEMVGEYQGEEVDVADLLDALEALEAEEFTDESADGQEEIALTVSLNNETFPQVGIRLSRYDGESCLAVVDGKSVSLVPRSQVVELTEAVRSIVWN